MPEGIAFESVPNGTVDVVMITEPLPGLRAVNVTERGKAPGFAEDL